MAIYDLTGTAAGFINEWESASPTVTAHTSGSTGAPKQVQLKKKRHESVSKGYLQILRNKQQQPSAFTAFC